MGLTPDFWHGRRVFLTGHTGFKGGWLSLWLHSMGAKVHGYSLPAATTPALFNEAQIERTATHTFADIRDAESLAKSMHLFQPEVVFHLAAQPLVRESYRNPAETYSTNVMGTLNVLEAVRNLSSVQAVVVITTDKCYENKEWVWPYREQDALGGYDPYSSSKACVELLCASYRQSFFQASHVKLATARAGNVIGGGDWSVDRLVPDVLAAWQKQSEVIIRAPLSVRPWQHVLEALHGYLILAEALFSAKTDSADAWNFGPDIAGNATVESVIKSLAQYWGDSAHWIVEPSQELHEAGLLALDSSKARSMLKWHTIWTLDEALKQTVLWHKAWSSQDNMQAFTLKQIKEFQDMVYE